MVRLYHHEYCNSEHANLPPTYFIESLTTDFPANGLIPFDIELRTMLDEIMMWCVTARLPEELVRLLLGLLSDLNFKVRHQRRAGWSIHVFCCSFFSPKHFSVSMVFLLNPWSMNLFPRVVTYHPDWFISVFNSSHRIWSLKMPWRSITWSKWFSRASGECFSHRSNRIDRTMTMNTFWRCIPLHVGRQDPMDKVLLAMGLS